MSLFTLSGGNYEVLGNFGPDHMIGGFINGFNFSVSADSYVVTGSANGTFLQYYSTIGWQGFPNFAVTDNDGDGVGNLFAGASVTASDNRLYSASINITLPDGFSIATPAVPEPATWLLLLLGFTAIGLFKMRGTYDHKATQ